MDRIGNPPRAPQKRRPSEFRTPDASSDRAAAMSASSAMSGASASSSRRGGSFTAAEDASASLSSRYRRADSPSNARVNAAQRRSAVGLGSDALPPPPPPSSQPPAAQRKSAVGIIPSPAASPTNSLLQRSAASTTSASSVSVTTRTSAIRNPHALDPLIEALLTRLSTGARTELSARRTYIRLTDASASSAPLDTYSVLDKIKRRIQLDAPQYYPQVHITVARLHESYSRFIKSPGVSKKGELLQLLYGLMDSTTPSQVGMQQQSGERRGILQKASSAQSIGSDGTPFESSNSSAPSWRSVPHNSNEAVAEPNQARLTIAGLEDSFKFAVGIAPTGSGSRSVRAKLEQRHSSASSSGGFASQDSFEVPEEVLVHGVIYAMQNIDSRYIFFDTAADRFQITRSVGVPGPKRERIHQLCELGWLYRKITQFVSQYSNDMSFGMVGHSFCHALNTKLVNYIRFLTRLSAQVDADAETKQPHERVVNPLSLRGLVAQVETPLMELRVLARLVDSVEGVRGGALASTVHSNVVHGNSSLRQHVHDVMTIVAAPIFRMIRRWVNEGILDDVQGEFFVVADSNVPDDQLWHKKYRLNDQMRPTFIPKELAKRILLVGKSINFIRQCCGETGWIMDGSRSSNAIADIRFEDGDVDLSALISMIESASKKTNETLISALVQKFTLLDHCRALRRYMLLGQGDFIQYLMDLLHPELSKRASQVYRHTIVGEWERALNASNAKFESQDTLARLDVQLLRASAGDTGWDIFSLHYRVPSPINTVINDAAMQQYHRIFHFLWRLKRVEYSLSTSWGKEMHLDHMVKNQFHAIRPVIHKCQLLRSEMIQFTTTLHNYVMFEVLETSWHALEKKITTASDLDDLISSHEEYISCIKEKAFMTGESKELLQQLKLIFDVVIRFGRAQSELHVAACRQVNAIKTHRQQIEERTAQGSWGITEDEDPADAFAAEFGPSSLIYRQLGELASEFRGQMMVLLRLLDARTARMPSLSLLRTRFDFNGYYDVMMNPSSGDE